MLIVDFFDPNRCEGREAPEGNGNGGHSDQPRRSSIQWNSYLYYPMTGVQAAVG